MSGIRHRRCDEGYGAKSLRILRSAKERGMHLTLDGLVVLPTKKVHKGTPYCGRDRVNLSIDGEVVTIQTARVICFLAHGEPPSVSSVADHIDGDTLNDSPENLRWATYSENTRNSHFSREKTWEQRAIDACEGIENPEGLRRQRDELIDNLGIWEEIREWLEMDRYIKGYLQANETKLSAVRASLAKIKG